MTVGVVFSVDSGELGVTEGKLRFNLEWGFSGGVDLSIADSIGRQLDFVGLVSSSVGGLGNVTSDGEAVSGGGGGSNEGEGEGGKLESLKRRIK